MIFKTKNYIIIYENFNLYRFKNNTKSFFLIAKFDFLLYTILKLVKIF